MPFFVLYFYINSFYKGKIFLYILGFLIDCKVIKTIYFIFDKAFKPFNINGFMDNKNFLY